MALYTFLQSNTYSTNTAATTHPITLSSVVRASGGSISPSTLILTMSYDGSAGNICTGITDTDGNTWQKGTSATDSSAVHGEMWYAYNAKGGAAPTITVTLSASQKITMAVVEVDQVRPVSPLDVTQARIHNTSGTPRTTGSTGVKRNGMVEVIIAGMGWKDATRYCSAAGSGFTGLVTLKDGSSNLGVAMVRTNTERKRLTSGDTIGRFTLDATSTISCAVMTLTFFRDGVVTSTDEDGFIDDIEGTATVYTDVSSYGGRWLYTSSTSAPNGGTGSSERSACYSFFPDYSSYLLTGVTIGNTIPLYYQGLSGGNDDGTGFMNANMYVFKDGTFGSTLNLSDESWGGGYVHDEGTTPTAAGEHQVNLDKNAEYNTSGYTTYGMAFMGDTQGGSSSTWAYLGDFSNNVPDYLWLSLTYPSTRKASTLALMGCG